MRHPVVPSFVQKIISKLDSWTAALIRNPSHQIIALSYTESCSLALHPTSVTGLTLLRSRSNGPAVLDILFICSFIKVIFLKSWP